MAKYGGYNFVIPKVTPLAIHTPHFSFGGTGASKRHSNNFKFSPLWNPPKKTQAWQDIEAATGKQFSSYEQAISYLVDQTTHKGGENPILGFAGNLLGDVKDTIVGLPIGIYDLNKAVFGDVAQFRKGDFDFSHTGKIAKALGQTYSHTYGPAGSGFAALAKGHWGDAISNFGSFKHNLYEHPLGPILDVASVVTLGAGAGVRAGSLLARVGEESGAIARTGRALQAAGKSEPLLVRTPNAIKAGQDIVRDAKGYPTNAIPYRFTSRNPVVRMKQKWVFKKMQDPTVGILGERINTRLKAFGEKVEERRFASKKLRLATHEDYARRYQSTDELGGVPASIAYENSFAGLNKYERAAGNILGLIGSHSEGGIKGFVERTKAQAAELGEQMPRDLEQLWLHPKTQAAYEAAVKAHKAGQDNKVLTFRNYAHELGIINAIHKGVDPEMAAMRSWSTLARNHASQELVDHIHAQVLKEHPEWDYRVTKYKNGKRVPDRVIQERHAHVVKEVDDRITKAYIAHKFGRGAEPHMGMEYQQAMAKYHEDYAKAVRQHKKRPQMPEAPANSLKSVSKDEIQPIYIPHRTGLDSKHGGNYAISAAVGSGKLTHRNLGVIQAMGRIAIGQDLLGKEFSRTLRTRHAMDIKQAMIDAAVEVAPEDVSQMVANGYHIIGKEKGTKKRFTEITSQHQLNQAWEATDNKSMLQKLDDFFLTKDAHIHGAENAMKRNGKFLMVKDSTYKHLRQEFVESSHIIKKFVEKPLNIWKYIVLGIVPRNIVTNVVGNSLMAALLAHGPLGAMKILFHSAIKTMTKEEITRELTFGGRLGVSNTFTQRWFPEHWQASFAHGEMNFHGRARKVAFAYKAAHRNEIALRQGMLMDIIKNEPSIRARFNALPKNGSTASRWQEAAAREFENDLHLRDEVAERVDDALGNYREFTNTERRVKNFMPFYSWYRHSARNMRAMTNRPTTINVLANLGAEGAQTNENAFPETPEFMKAFIPLGKHGDRIGALNTAGINPYHAIVEMGDAVKNLAVSKDKQGSTGKIASFLNPFIGAGIEEGTGMSLLTGAPSKAPTVPGVPNNFLANVGLRIAGGTPEARVAGSSFDAGFGSKPSGIDLLTPTGRFKKPKVNTLSKGNNTVVANFLGFPVKDVNVKAAQEWQKKLETSGKFHLPKSRKKAPKKYKFGTSQWK